MDMVVGETLVNNPIGSGKICLFYQPQYSLQSARLVGLEALLRCWDSELGWVSPVKLIAQAEQSDAIHKLGFWILQEVFEMASRLTRAGVSGCKVAANVSPQQLPNPDFYTFTQECMLAYSSSLNPVELEITESRALADLDLTLIRLNKLRQMGFKLALDDFGSGFSSLSYLGKLPISKLKMDRSFVVELDTCNGSRILVQSIVNLAHQLGIDVIAEGVETVKQANILRDMGCDQVQGYLYGRPQCERDILRLLESKTLCSEQSAGKSCA